MRRLLWLAFFYQQVVSRVLKRSLPTTNEPLQSTTLIPQHTVKKLVCAFMDTRRRSSVDDDDDVPPAPAPRPAPSYADTLRADEWPSLGS